MSRRRRAVIVVMREPVYELKQWDVLLEYCGQRHLVVASVTRDVEAAVALVVAGLRDVVVAPVPDRARVLLTSGVPVEFLRRIDISHTREAALIASMLSRGGSAETVAQLLGVPLSMVLDVQRTPATPAVQQAADRRTARLGDELSRGAESVLWPDRHAGRRARVVS